MHFRTNTVALVLTLLGVTPSPEIYAQALPSGGDFSVNAYTTGGQQNPSVAPFGAGGFVVTWDSQDDGQTGAVQEIAARVFEPSGAAVAEEFIVNEFTVGNQSFPSVAGSATAGFVVAWQSFGQDGPPDSSAIVARRFDATGALLGSEFVVNGYTTGRQARAVVRMAPSGEFVVVWISGSSGGTQDGDREGVFGRKYDAQGLPVGSEFQANQFTTGSQATAGVAMNEDGAFLVAWENGFLSGGDGSGSGVFARAFGTNATPAGDQFRVNLLTASEQRRPSVATAADGSFLVTWESFGQDGDGGGIVARKFSAAGMSEGTETIVNAFTTGMQVLPVASASGLGGFTVVWQQVDDGPTSVLVARDLDETGTPQGGDFAVSSGTGNYLFGQSIAATQAGFVIAWQEDGRDGDQGSIIARRFGDGATNVLCGDANDDGFITASDALFALQSAVGAQQCALCVCDVSGDGYVRAGDALVLLRVSVGQQIAMNCPPCV